MTTQPPIGRQAPDEFESRRSGTDHERGVPLVSCLDHGTGASRSPGAQRRERPYPPAEVTGAGHWPRQRLAFLTSAHELLDRARERLLEVDQLRPRRLDDDPDHRVVQRPDLGLPLGPLLGRHLVEPFVEHRFTPEQQDLRWVHLGVDGEGDRRGPAQRRQLWGVRRGAHDDSVPFQVNAIGTTLGVPSLAMYASRARSRLSISCCPYAPGCARSASSQPRCRPAAGAPVRFSWA